MSRIAILSYAVAAMIAAGPAFAASTATVDHGTASKGKVHAQADQTKAAKPKQAQPAKPADEKTKKVESHKTDGQPKR